MLPTYNYIAGTGFDVHALSPSTNPNNTIALGGIRVPAQFIVDAHSDGDVILHALVDALLGAIGEGDIGEHFPPSDQQWKNANSTQFLLHALSLVKREKATIINTDITVISETPKVSPHKNSIRQKVAELLNLPLKRVNIKATTTEKLGFLGRKEGIAAQAIVMLKTPETIND